MSAYPERIGCPAEGCGIITIIYKGRARGFILYCKFQSLIVGVRGRYRKLKEATRCNRLIVHHLKLGPIFIAGGGSLL